MRGDVILVEEHHYEAARKIVAQILSEIRESDRPYTITVAGESGSGKSETAQALAEVLGKEGIRCSIYQQDDYFVHPPKTNDATRRKDIDWVGPQEVRLGLLDEHLEAARAGRKEVTKPLVIYAEDRVSEETISLDGVRVVIAEGTYTTLLGNVDKRIFIDRTRVDTIETRKKRAREQPDPFIERVLEIEHAIISQHKARAGIIIEKDYDVRVQAQ